MFWTSRSLLDFNFLNLIASQIAITECIQGVAGCLRIFVESECQFGFLFENTPLGGENLVGLFVSDDQPPHLLLLDRVLPGCRHHVAV